MKRGIRFSTLIPAPTQEEASTYGWLHKELGFLIAKIRERRLGGIDGEGHLDETYFCTHQIIVDTLAKQHPERVPMFATALYWMFNHEIVRFALSEAMRVPAGELPDHLYAYRMSTTCDHCGASFMHARRSHHEQAKTVLCPNCTAATEPDLKTMPYAEYLKTEHWNSTRKAALKAAEYRCQMCNASKPLHVHHRTYERRGNEKPSDLIALCADCHKTFHENGKLKEGAE